MINSAREACAFVRSFAGSQVCLSLCLLWLCSCAALAALSLSRLALHASPFSIPIARRLCAGPRLPLPLWLCLCLWLVLGARNSARTIRS